MNTHFPGCRQSKNNKNVFLVDSQCHPQSIAVVETRASHLGVEVLVQDHRHFQFSEDVCGVLLQYPNTDGQINDFRDTIEQAHQHQVCGRGRGRGHGGVAGDGSCM